MQVAVQAFFGKPDAEKVSVAPNASAVISERARLRERLLGLPVDLGDIFEKLAIDVLAAETGLFGIIVNTVTGQVALDAMDHHTALGGVMRRADPGLRGVRVDVALLVTKLVRRCGVHACFSGQNDCDAEADSYSD